ncbi:MAG: DNA methylase [Clostridia bacterium]|nr:DNA methylase [Clostridia bacterium]
MEKTYIAIDLKSFYASVECIERGLDPMSTNLLVADPTRTEKTICLAVSPSLKSYGVPGRPRLFEALEALRLVNMRRRQALPDKAFKGKSCDNSILCSDPSYEVGFITAPPRMALYMQYSTRIYEVYLKYIAPEDIHVYSIDEVFIDATHYLKKYKMNGEELARTMILDVLKTTGITATAGVGTNLYLCKVAMDIWAKHIPADENGVRIASLNERAYRELLWNHRPLTDFWRVGRGYAKKLEAHGLYTMGDIARCSVGGDKEYHNEKLLYKLFGVNAELLIDHAWGWEPCTIADIKAYKPTSSSLTTGQVLTRPYKYEETKLIVREMTELLVLDLVEKELVTDQIVLTIGYDIENLSDKGISSTYNGEVTIDRYGRKIPKHAHGTGNIGEFTSSTKDIMAVTMELFERIINPNLLARRINICANHVVNEKNAPRQEVQQLDLFTDYNTLIRQEQECEEQHKKEKNMQRAMIQIKNKFGKNAILKGMNLQEGGTTIERNSQIGGHRA